MSGRSWYPVHFIFPLQSTYFSSLFFSSPSSSTENEKKCFWLKESLKVLKTALSTRWAGKQDGRRCLELLSVRVWLKHHRAGKINEREKLDTGAVISPCARHCRRSDRNQSPSPRPRSFKCNYKLLWSIFNPTFKPEFPRSSKYLICQKTSCPNLLTEVRRFERQRCDC